MSSEISSSVAQEIAETVRDLCGYDINFIGTDGYIFASTDSGRIGTFHQIAKQVADTGTAIEVDSASQYRGTQPGINLPVFYHNSLQGVIGISGPPGEAGTYAYLAQRIAVMILREHDRDVRNFNRQNEFQYLIRSLTGDVLPDREYLEESLKAKNMPLSGNFGMIITRINTHASAAASSDAEYAILEFLRGFSRGIYTFSFPNEYYLLLSEDDYPSAINRLRALSASHPDTIRVGVGVLCDLYAQKNSLETARMALREAGYGQAICYTDLDLEILLGNIPRQALENYLNKTTAALSEEERELLKLYYESGMSLKAVSENMYLHKNTIQYRLERIHEKTGYDPRNFKDAVILYLGLKALSRG